MASTSCFGHRPFNTGVQAFRDYIHYQLGKHSHEGLDGHMKARQFICKQSLTSYWTVDKIRKVLAHGGSRVSDDVVLKITSRHVLEFSVLSYIGYPDCIVSLVDKDLTDAQLPLLNDFGCSCQAPQSCKVWELFSKEQWKFTPLVFGTGTHANELPIDRNQILPIRNITRLEVTTGLLDTKIHKVSLYPCCSHLPANEVVFKCLVKNSRPRIKPSHARLQWEREAAVRAEISRASSPSLGVIKSFGSYVWSVSGESPSDGHGLEASSTRGQSLKGHEHVDSETWTHFIILEFASGGTLAEFLKTTAMSSPNWQDQFNFWCQMFNILSGIISIGRLNM